MLLEIFDEKNICKCRETKTHCHFTDEFSDEKKETLDELVRDLTCRTKPMAKSEVRRRIEEYADEYSKREETFYSTIVNSDIWREWIDYQNKILQFDVDESTECNMLSARHFEEFIKWVENRKLREEYKINWKDLKDK